ncbi:hypothetical protein ACIA74_21565 [Streptomyces sp. NPDC051658]|uniref:hypothetical protein n=1 Tax=Streptomyces sp. NPDC051658 TaxID=3365667 RepID=UPI0037990364
MIERTLPRPLLAKDLIVGLGVSLTDAQRARIEPLLQRETVSPGSSPFARHGPMPASREDTNPAKAA